MSMKNPIPRKIGILYFLIIQLSGSAISGLVLIFMNMLSWDIFVQKQYVEPIHEFERLLNEQIPMLQKLQYYAPFVVISLVSLVYIWPLFKRPKDEHLESQKLRRFINLPIFSFFTTLFGWMSSTLIQSIGIWLTNPPKEFILSLGMSRFVLPSLTGTLIGFLNFYMLEFINQRFIIPRYFSKGEILQEPRTIKLSISARFFILMIGSSLLPLIFINMINFNASDNPIPILAYSILFIISSLLLTLFMAYIFREPLQRMDRVTQNIQRGEYDVQTPVISGDELGRLSYSLNNMARGLKEKEHISETFGRLVDPSVRDHLLKGEINLGGETAHATVLFTDIRDFTTLSENLNAQQVVHMVNRYFSMVARAIEEQGGMINKFMGDAVMALFGLPLPLEHHGERAVKAGMHILELREELNRQFLQEGLPEIKTGIGIHTGQVVAGNIGSHARMEYTAMGDSVNVASRLESSCKKLGKDLIFSEETAQSCSNAENFKRLGKLQVKGRIEPVIIYSLS